MKYFHELTQDECNKLLEEKKTVGYLMKNYKQPEWCNYPNALEGMMGCWTLVDFKRPTPISKEYCKTCDCFKKS